MKNAVSDGSREALARLQLRSGKADLNAPSSLSEKAYQSLRHALQEGVFEQSTRLTEVDLAAWLQMSRTPVREAMRRLESEGVLRNEPFRGVTVVTLNEKDVQELFAVRELLEVAAAGWCAVQASDAEIDILRRIVEIEATKMNDPRALFDLNRQLHQEICNGAHNAFLSKALAAVQSSFTLLGRSNLLDTERARAAHRQHQLIVDAIAKRDRNTAEKAAKSHVQTSLRQRLTRLSAKPNPAK